MEIKASTLFNSDFANNNISSCFFFFLNYWLILFNCWISYSYYRNFNPIAELRIPIGITTKEAKAKMETYPLTVDVKISEC